MNNKREQWVIEMFSNGKWYPQIMGSHPTKDSALACIKSVDEIRGKDLTEQYPFRIIRYVPAEEENEI